MSPADFRLMMRHALSLTLAAAVILNLLDKARLHGHYERLDDWSMPSK
jgi:hypothetical protein